MKPEISTAIGKSNTSLICSYRNEQNYIIYNLEMQVKNETTNFFQIASFYPPLTQRNATLTAEGNYLKGRVTLTNPTNHILSAAMLLFDEIHCEDAMEYRCIVHYDLGGKNTLTESNTTKITITNPPKMPENIELVNSLSAIVEGQNVSMVCKGDVGNPPGKFIWKKYRYNDHIPETYSNIMTTHEKVTVNCTYYGTSFLSIQLTSLDNKASFLCVEESLASSDNMGLITVPINVYYKIRNVTVTKTPDMESYPADCIDHLNLTCNAYGNPEPMYSWFREENPDTILSETNTLNIKYLAVNKSGNYVCKADNKINYNHYNKTAKVNITIVDRMNFPPDNKMDSTSNVYTYAGICIALAIVVVLFSYCFFKKRYSERNKCNVMARDIVSASNNQSIPLDSKVELSAEYATVKDKNKMEPVSSTGLQKNEYADVEIRNNGRSTEANRNSDNICNLYTAVAK